MRIAFIVDKSLPFYVGGYEARFWFLAKELSKTHEVRVYTTTEQSSCSIDGVTFRRVSTSAFQQRAGTSRSLLHGGLFALSLSRNPFADWDPDVIVLEAIPGLHLLTASRWLSRSKATKIVNFDEYWLEYSYTTGLLRKLTRRAIRALYRASFRWANAAIVPSSATARALGSERPDFPVFVIPSAPGVVANQYASPAQAPEKATVPLSGEYDFVTVGRLVQIKRHRDFILGLARLQSTTAWKGRAAVIGEGPERLAIMDLVRASGLESQVDVPGMLTETELSNILRRSRIFVLCSEREGFSMATLEAMAMRLAPIVARPTQAEVFGVGDLIKDGETGVTYPVGNIEELTQRMKELLTDPQKLEPLRERAKSSAARFSWVNSADSLEAAILNVKGAG